MKYRVVTLFPEFVKSFTETGVVGQALKKQLISLQTLNPRQFTQDVHQSVDDRPFGGGDGMVMMAEPLAASLEHLDQQEGGRGRVVYLSPQGIPWSNSLAKEWAQKEDEPLTLICGRYAGVDQRFVNAHVDVEVSVGDYILSGGELAALILIDSISRFVPGVLGNAHSPYQESFAEGLLEAPQFTRPQESMGGVVPQKLLSGNHAQIQQFRQALSIVLTHKKRPDLLKNKQLEIAAAQKQLQELSDEELDSCGLSRKDITEKP